MYKYIILMIAVLSTACGGGTGTTDDFDGTGGMDPNGTGGMDPNGTGGLDGTGNVQNTGGTGVGGTSIGSGGTGLVTGSGGLVSTGGSGEGNNTVCTPNQKVCENGDAKICNSNGAFWLTQNCEFACQNGECTGGCVPDDTQCNGDTLQTCDGNGNWVDTTSCAFVCDSGACTGTCTPNDKTCDTDGKTPRLCDDLGQWVNASECEFSCTDGDCTGACTDGTTTCLGNSAATCVGDSWSVDENCEFVCSSGSCTGVCAPDTKQCSGNSLQTCGSNGQWGSASPCTYACYNGACTGVCTPGATRCNGFDVETCNSQGQWGYSSTCMGDIHGTPTCGGAGVCGIDCENGYDNCDGDITNGCESLSSPEHCGSCGNSCSASSGFEPSCDNFGGILTCGQVCAVGTEDCDGNPSNGCEVDILNDENNCGGCNENWHNMAICSGTCTLGICQLGGADSVNDRLFTGPWDDNEIIAYNNDLFFSSISYKEFRVRNFSGTRFDTFALTDKPYSIRNFGPIFVIATLDELDRGGLLRYDDRDHSFVVMIDGSEGFSPGDRNAIDDTYYYWAERADATSTPNQKIYRIPLDNSTGPTLLATVPYINHPVSNSKNYIIIAGNYLMYGPYNQSKIVVLNKITGASVTDVVYPVHNPIGTNWMPLVGDNNRFFYYDGGGISQTNLGTWDSVNAVGFTNWAYLDTELVTANTNSSGTIQFFNPVSKAQKTLTTPQLISNLAVDSSYVYGSWNNRLYSVYRMARP